MSAAIPSYRAEFSWHFAKIYADDFEFGNPQDILVLDQWFNTRLPVSNTNSKYWKPRIY